ALRRYRGRTVALPGGTVLRRGDLIGELHINNEVIRKLSSLSGTDQVRAVFAAKKEAQESLAALAGWLKKNPRYAKIKAIAGISLLVRGSRSLGFASAEVHPLVSRLFFWYESMVLARYHPLGKNRVTGHRQKLKPKLLVMSKEELFRRYLEIDKNTMEKEA
ncbi:MAG: YkoP family protein, partial [Desulfotomaculales bacterium]